MAVGATLFTLILDHKKVARDNLATYEFVTKPEV